MQSLIFQESIFKPFRTLQDPICYAHTKFGEDISIGGEDMLPKQNSKKNAKSRQNSTSGFNSTVTPSELWGPLYVSSCQISAKLDNWQPSYSDLTILAFNAHFGVPFAPTHLRVGGPTPTQLVP